MTRPSPWLLLCKPVRAPFRDGTSVLVRNLLRALPSSFEAVYFGDPRAPIRERGDRVLPASAMRYQPGLADKLGMFARTLAPAQARLPIHSLFAANATSSRALELLRRTPLQRPVIQTLPASTGAERVASMLARLDRVVVTSSWGRTRLLDAGLDAARVVRIYPGVELPPSTGLPPLSTRRSLLYAGDLDPAVGERLIALADALESREGWCLDIATRPKGERHEAVRRRLRTALAPALEAGRARLHGEVEDIDALFDRAALQLYLADHARNKVDIPFALLEGMARGLPVAIVDAEPVAELLELADAAGLEVGLRLSSALGRDEPSTTALLAALDDPQRLAQMGSKARELVERHFSATEMATSYHRLYERTA